MTGDTLIQWVEIKHKQELDRLEEEAKRAEEAAKRPEEAAKREIELQIENSKRIHEENCKRAHELALAHERTLK